MPDEFHFRDAEMIGKPDNVPGQPVEIIGVDALRLATEIIAALIGHDDAETGRDERRNLRSPARPELGKSVQQNDRRRVGGASLRIVKIDAVDPCPSEPDALSHSGFPF
jgi:hypothetical protein